MTAAKYGKRQESDGLRRKGEVWYGRWIDHTGREIERSLSKDYRRAKRMRAEAAEAARRVRVGIDEEPQVDAALRPMVDEYLADVRARCSPRHLTNVREGLGDMLKRMHALTLRDVTTSAVLSARNALTREGLSNATANQRAGYVVSLMRWLEATDRIARNPLKQIKKLPVVGRHRRRVARKLTREEMTVLFEAVQRSSVDLLTALVAGTGMRLTEAVGATWGELEGSALVLSANRTKNSRERVVALPSWLVARLDAERGARSPKKGDPIAPRPDGRAHTRYSAYFALRRVLESCDGLERIAADGSRVHWHALRHTYATMMAAVDASVITLQRQFGWQDPQMAQRYVDGAQAPAADAVSRVEQGWAPRPVQPTGQMPGKSKRKRRILTRKNRSKKPPSQGGADG